MPVVEQAELVAVPAAELAEPAAVRALAAPVQAVLVPAAEAAELELAEAAASPTSSVAAKVLQAPLECATR